MNTSLPDTLEAGQILEVQLSPFGTFPGYANDHEITQHCDKVAFTSIVERFNDEVLVDFEHEAETGGSTTAAAWIQSVRVDEEKGLMATFKFTDVGAEAIRERRLRFLSPVWLINEDGRPFELISVGLTNKPNLPVRPILNRAAATVVNVEEHPQKETVTMKEALLELLGLPPETEDAAIIDAVAALKTTVEEQTQAALNNEAEEAADENKEQIQNREAFVQAYKANPEQARAFIASLKKPAPVATNRFQGATAPMTPLHQGNEDIAIAKEWKAMAHGPQKDAFLTMNKAAILRGLEAM